MKKMEFEGYNPFTLALAGITAVSVAYLGYVLFFYGSLEGYLDHVEPNIAISSWRFLGGHSLFQGLDEWPKLGSYGPLLYLIHSTAFKLGGGSVLVSKFAALAVSAGSVLIFFCYAYTRFGALKAYVGVLLFIAITLLFSPYSFWNRPDPFTVFLVTLAVFAKNLPADRWGRWAPHAVVGICIGLTVNLKVHSFIYFIPVVVDLCGWKNIREMIVIGLISIAVFLLPFAHPQISLAKYLDRMFGTLSIRGGLDTGMLVTSFRYSLFFYSPALLLAGLLARGRNHVDGKCAIYFAALAVSTTIALYPASIIGTGPYHLLPLIAVTIDSMLRFTGGYDDMPRLQKGIFVLIPVIFLTVSLPVQRRLMRNMERIAAENAAGEIHKIIKEHEDETVQMGYGETFEGYRLSFYKPILIFAGQPGTVDAQEAMEFQSIGYDFTGRFTAQLERCETRHWLIPKGETPFMMQSYYQSVSLFGGAAEVFQEKYTKAETLDHFDLWSCRD
ncbi:MAG: hypothetical protein V3R66_04915 [Rhodospirillales bacterium]